jgi:large subunit ribosomal protein L1
MAKVSKRRQAINKLVDFTKQYDALEAFKVLASCPLAKFKEIESVDVAIRLGVDARKSEQMVRGATVLPNGTGRTVRVAVFAQGANAEKAKAAGADIVGFEDLGEEIKKGNMDFDVVIATPDAMRIVGQLGQVLGPRGLMPNPKVGTVTPDVETAVINAKSGQVRYRIDKGGIIHCSIGKATFTPEKLKQNLDALLADLIKAKPSVAKGIYVRKVTVSTTMGPGIVLDLASLVKS